MCEVHKPDWWPKVVRDAIDAGGKVCKFQNVPVKGDCLVKICIDWVQNKIDWSRGIKLPEFNPCINFVVTDERALWLNQTYRIPLDAVVIAIPEAKLKEETVDTTYGELVTGDEFLLQGVHYLRTEWTEAVALEGKRKGRKLSSLGSFRKIKKIIRKGKTPEKDVPTPDSAGPGAPFNC